MRTKLRDAVNVNAESPLAFDPAEGGMEGTLRMGNPGGNTQLSYFIDPVNGNDQASGLTAATAIKTEKEWIDRIGGQVINVAMVVTLLNDFPADNPFYSTDKDVQVGPTGSVSFIDGKPLTTLASGTLTGATAINAATNSPQTITDAGLAVSWAAIGAINLQAGACVRIRLTANGAVAYGWKESVLKTLSTTPFTIPATTPSGFPTPYVPAGNEAYVVETGFLSIAEFRFFWSGTTNASNGRMFFGAGLAFPNGVNRQGLIGSMNTVDTAVLPDSIFQGCDVGRMTPFGGIASFGTCKISGTFNVYAQGFINTFGCLATLLMEFQGSSGGGSILAGDTTFALGGRINCETTGLLMQRVGIFDAPGGNIDAIRIFPGCSIRALNIAGTNEAVYGSGSTRAGINCIGGWFYYQNNKPTVTGLVTDTRISGVNLSYVKVPFINVINDIYRTGLVGTVTGGVTRFLLPDYTESAADVLGYLVEEPCVVRNLRILAGTAPGGAVSDVYTVFKNGVATTVTATMTGAAVTASDTTNSFTAVAGDRLSLQVVEGAGSVAANIITAVEVLATNSTGGGIALAG